MSESENIEPSPGFKFCVNRTCGVEVKWEHPTGACRAHRGEGTARRKRRPVLAVSPYWAPFTVLRAKS